LKGSIYSSSGIGVKYFLSKGIAVFINGMAQIYFTSVEIEKESFYQGNLQSRTNFDSKNTHVDLVFSAGIVF